MRMSVDSEHSSTTRPSSGGTAGQLRGSPARRRGSGTCGERDSSISAADARTGSVTEARLAAGTAEADGTAADPRAGRASTGTR
jgi:hypothetical protein